MTKLRRADSQRAQRIAAGRAATSSDHPPEPGSAFSSAGLTLQFRGQGQAEPTTVLEKVSFTIGAGEFVSILGGSGVGKTTLLRALGGLHPRAPGSSLTHRGTPINAPPPGVVMVFQDYSASLLPWRTVERNVALGLPAKLSKAEIAARVAESLQMIGLAGYRRHYPAQLSGGMQQRVQIARALVTRPEVLLMDEPFGALDAMTKAALQDALLAIQDATKATVVFVTHDVDEAIYLSDRILFLAGSPARIELDLPVGLGRPRDQVLTKENAQYLSVRHTIYEVLERTRTI